MPTTVTLPLNPIRSRPAISDSAVALAFAFIPAILMAVAVAVFGFNPVMAWAASGIG